MSADDRATRDTWRPSQIGPYRVLDTLGEGGMGTVYLVEQKEPVRRRAALKLIKPGMDSKAILARFEAERKALAMMEHSCIATVYDAGLTDLGQPYFVMEYVKGVPITEYADTNKLDLRERIELLQRVCSGVQHAHLKGVMHRDLKPSNVLVTVQDGKPQPKIIDFGLAKATDHHLVEATIYTEQGQIIGTPEYMSPEQAGLGGLDVDTRTDVYSLGVLLHELLVGELPFTRNELRGAGYLEMQRVIREQEPKKPSTKITTIGDVAGQHATARRLDVVGLQRALMGDLDWIVLKALEKDRTRRYETALELAADLERHLRFEPVLACPPRVGYRIRRWARRNRGVVAGVVAVALTLVCGAVTSLAFAVSAHRSSAEADEQRHIAQSRQAAAAEALTVAEQQRESAVKAQRDAEVAAARATWQSYVANIHGAAAAIRLGDSADARQCLDACANDVRGWEWSTLVKEADSSLFVLPAESWARSSLSVDPEGKVVQVVADSKLLRWSLETGQPMSSVDLSRGDRSGGESMVLAVSPDGRRLVAYDWKVNKAQLVDVEHQHAIGDALVHEGGVNVAISSDGKLCALFGEEWREPGKIPPPIRVLDMSSGFLVREIEERAPSAVAIAGDSRSIFVARGAAIDRWSLDDGTKVRVVDSEGQRVAGIATDAQGHWLVWGGRHDLHCVDLATGRETWVHKANNVEEPTFAESVCTLAFDSAGQRVVSGAGDRVLRLWDAANGDILDTCVGHTELIERAVFSKDGALIASVARDETVRVWDARRRQAVATVHGGDPDLTSIDVSRDGRLLATSSWYPDGRTGRVWTTASGRLQTVLRGMTSGIWSIALSPDGATVATGSEGGGALWDAESGVLLRALVAADDRTSTSGRAPDIGRVAFDPSGTWLATGEDFDGSADRRIRVWLVKTGSMVAEARDIGGVEGLVWSSRGKLGVVVVNTGIVEWNGDLTERALVVKGGADCLAYSSDGLSVAVGDRNGRCTIYDARSWAAVGGMDAHERPTCIEWHPDGNRLAVGTDHGEVVLFHVPTCTKLLTFKTGYSVASLRWSSQGDTLYAGTRNGRVLRWSSVGWRELRQRRSAETAQFAASDEVMTRLLAQHGNLSAVQSHLAAESLDESVRAAVARELAVQLEAAEGPKPLTARKLNSKARTLCFPSGRPEADYRLAVELSEQACALASDLRFLSTLAVAKYRVGQFQEAITALRKGVEADPDSAMDLGFLVMALARSGDTTSASAVLVDLRRVVAAVRGDEDAVLVLREAEAVLQSCK